MYFYAFLDENDICTQIYAMPAQISGTQFIAINANDQSLIGQRFNRGTSEFEVVYYYAVLNNKNVVTSVTYNTAQQATSATLLAITFAQYQTVTGLYWNGTEFIVPPISVLAIASTNDVNYKDEEKWLSTKLDEMDGAIAGNASNISTLSTGLSTVATDLQTVVTAMGTMATVIEGKANAAHTHIAADLSGVVKTVNGNAPDAEGNITITNSGMTAAEILAALKTVDGSGSGIDADTLDGNDASYFASVTALNGKADASHTHDEYVTTEAMNAALTGKSDSTHNHNATYAPLAHAHSLENVTGLVTALAGKSDTSHNHNTAYAAISHAHTIENVTGLATALSGKSDNTHNHDSVYATVASVTALESAVNDIETELDGKSNTNHTHTGYATTTDLNAVSAALGNKANATHSHAISNVTGLQSALNGKADSSHNHDANYLSINGGTIGGNIDVSGVVRVNGSQMLSYSGGNAVIGTNNATGVTIGCASNGTVSVNGQYFRPYNILPRDNESTCGNANFRWAGIYSKASVNIASDERLKEGIVYVDTDPLLEFVKCLKVADYKYIGSDENRIGLIAQDVINANPEIAKYFVNKGEDGYYNLKPADFVFPLIAAVQELYRRIEK